MTKTEAKELINKVYDTEYRVHIMEIDEKKTQITYSFSWDKEANDTTGDERFQADLNYAGYEKILENLNNSKK